jgi:hypothetical protein
MASTNQATFNDRELFAENTMDRQVMTVLAVSSNPGQSTQYRQALVEAE